MSTINLDPTSPLTFAVTKGPDVTPDQLSQCTSLFSEHYGVWGPKAIETNKYLKPGSRVKMSIQKLTAECLQSKETTEVATCTTIDGVLIGHAFATTWDYGLGKVCWITQLVRTHARQRGIATSLLQHLKHPDHTAIGIASSHPAACLTACRLAQTDISCLDMTFVRSTIHDVLAASPVRYLSTAVLRGSLFDAEAERQRPDGPVCTLFTAFYVDHEEPRAALAQWRARVGGDVDVEVSWPLGNLLDGHEYLVLAPIR